jgi:hypothetical protein
VVSVPDYRLKGVSQTVSSGYYLTIADAEIEGTSIGYADVYQNDHPDVDTEGDWNPEFQTEIAANIADPVEVDIEFFIVPSGSDSVADGYKLGEINSTVGVNISTFTKRFSWSEMMESGFETGVEHAGMARVSGEGQTHVFHLRDIILNPPTIDPSAVSIFACDGNHNAVSPGSETGFTAQVTNNNDVTVEVGVEWYANGTLVGNTLADIPANTGKEVENSGVSHGYLLNQVGSGDFSLTAEISVVRSAT